MPSPTPPDDDRESVKQMIMDAGFTAAQAEQFLTGPPAEARQPVPLVENKGRVEGPLGAGGGSTGRHSHARGTVDGDRT